MRFSRFIVLLLVVCAFITLIVLMGCDHSSNSSNNKINTNNITTIEIDPAGKILNVGEIHTYKANLIQGDKKTLIEDGIVWKSDNEAIVTIDQQGKAIAKGDGVVTISASYNKMRASALITVKLASAKLQKIIVTPEKPTLYLGEREQFSAVGHYADNSVENITGMVIWSSSVPETLTITEQGMGKTKSLGTSDVTAKKITQMLHENTPKIITGSTEVTVKDEPIEKISIQPEESTLYLNQQKSFHVEALYGNGDTADITDKVAWYIDDEKGIATITQQGVVEGKKIGEETISATYKEKTAIATVHVEEVSLQKISIASENNKMNQGEQRKYYAIGVYTNGEVKNLTEGVNWDSENPSVIFIDKLNGLAKSLTTGKTTIRVKDEKTGKTATTNAEVSDVVLESLLVIPHEVNIPVGVKKQLIAEGFYSDKSNKSLTESVTWRIGNEDIAAIDPSTGVITAKRAVITWVEAEYKGKKDRSNIKFTKKQLTSLNIDPADIAIPVGVSKKYIATALYSDESTEIVTQSAEWSVTTANATMNKKTGQLKAIEQGETAVKATFEGKEAQVPVTVVDATLESLEVIPRYLDSDMIIGNKVPLKALGIFSNNERVDMTDQVVWVSSSPSVLAVIPEGERAGQITAQSIGRADIKAIDIKNKKTAEAWYIVADKALEDITVHPDDSAVSAGNSLRFIAEGSYSDGRAGRCHQNRNVVILKRGCC